MKKIDFNQYPKIEERIQECNLMEEKHDLIWLSINMNDAAVLIVEMHQLCKAGLSLSIPLRNRSKNGANYYYGYMNRTIHVFAKEHARHELDLTPEDVSNLFCHRGIDKLFNKMYPIF